jgi:hypothetical protein
MLRASIEASATDAKDRKDCKRFPVMGIILMYDSSSKVPSLCFFSGITNSYRIGDVHHNKSKSNISSREKSCILSFRLEMMMFGRSLNNLIHSGTDMNVILFVKQCVAMEHSAAINVSKSQEGDSKWECVMVGGLNEGIGISIRRRRSAGCEVNEDTGNDDDDDDDDDFEDVVLFGNIVMI